MKRDALISAAIHGLRTERDRLAAIMAALTNALHVLDGRTKPRRRRRKGAR